jgi:hypothetical protein
MNVLRNAPDSAVAVGRHARRYSYRDEPARSFRRFIVPRRPHSFAR